MDGVRLDPAAMASDKDPAVDSVLGAVMGVPVVHGLDKAGQVLDVDGGKTDAVGDQAAAAAHAEGLSKELGSLDPSLAVMMQAPAPASRAQTPPPDVAGAMMQHGLLPLPPGAEGLLGAGAGVGVPQPAGGGLLGALTAVPGGVGAGAPGSAAAAAALSKVGDLAGGIKDDKMAALDAAGRLKEQKKVGAPALPPGSARLCCRLRRRRGDAVLLSVCARCAAFAARRQRRAGKGRQEAKGGRGGGQGHDGAQALPAQQAEGDVHGLHGVPAREETAKLQGLQCRVAPVVPARQASARLPRVQRLSARAHQEVWLLLVVGHARRCALFGAACSAACVALHVALAH